jgi:hypothetical protein
MNPDTMFPAEYEQLFPEHAKAKRVWEKSQAIANFTDFLRSNKVEVCHQHVHVNACYGPWTPAMEPIGAFLREVEGVKHRAVICGHQSRDVYQPIGDLLTGLTARYFGIDLAAYDQEEVDLRKLRAGDHSMPSFEHALHLTYDNTLPETGHIDCPCWVTGKYVWVEGCAGHPRESMT